MWVGYMQEVLNLKSPSERNNTVVAASHGSLLVSADYHGAEVEVVQSGCVDRVGLKGIVVRDTKFTFVIVNTMDEVKSEFLLRQDTTLDFSILHSTMTVSLNHHQRFRKRTLFSGSRFLFPTAPMMGE